MSNQEQKEHFSAPSQIVKQKVFKIKQEPKEKPESVRIESGVGSFEGTVLEGELCGQGMLYDQQGKVVYDGGFEES